MLGFDAPPFDPPQATATVQSHPRAPPAAFDLILSYHRSFNSSFLIRGGLVTPSPPCAKQIVDSLPGFLIVCVHLRSNSLLWMCKDRPVWPFCFLLPSHLSLVHGHLGPVSSGVALMAKATTEGLGASLRAVVLRSCKLVSPGLCVWLDDVGGLCGS